MRGRVRYAGIAFMLLCAGCAPRPGAPPVAAPNPRLHLALDLTPRPATSLDPTTLTVRITDAAGKPVSGVSAAAHLDMPTMPMGQNEVALDERRPGWYLGSGRFTMAGAWRVTVTASKGPERAAQAFPVEVK